MGELSREPLAADLGWPLAERVTRRRPSRPPRSRAGISPCAHHALMTAVQGEYTETELARIVGLDKTTMAVTLDELEAQAWSSAVTRLIIAAPGSWP